MNGCARTAAALAPPSSPWRGMTRVAGSSSGRTRPRGSRSALVAATLAAAVVELCTLGCAQAQEGLDLLRNAPAVADVLEEAPPKRTGKARFFDPTDGQFDLSYFLEDPRGFLPIPIIVTEPAVGYGGGIAGMFLRPRRDAGDEGWARPNLSAVGALATANGTWSAFGGDSSLWQDGRLKTLLAAATGRINLDFYGFGGTAASVNRAVRYSLDIVGGVGQVDWRIDNRSPWWVGLRYVYADVDPKLRDEPIFPDLANGTRVTVSAPTLALTYDSRDNIFTPTRGVWAETSYMLSRTALGSTDDFERFQQILIGWLPLGNALTLGARGEYLAASDATPFFLLPYVALRGVPAMRYPGERVLSGEVELRWQLNERWSLVGFGGAGEARADRGSETFTSSVASGGVGFRYLLASKFGLHVGIDVAHSPGTTAVYLQVGNAWFRP